MKIIFWFVGCPCSGKTYYSKKLAERGFYDNESWNVSKNKKVKFNVIHLDWIYQKTVELGMTREEAYKDMFKDLTDIAIIEGTIPFRDDNNDMEIIKNLTKDHHIIYVNVEPSYKQWLKNWKEREKSTTEGKANFKTEKEYIKRNKLFTDYIKEYILIQTEKDLNKIPLNHIKDLQYQKEGFTDIKFKQLKIDTKGKTLLDLGCNACGYEKESKNHLKYTGLDKNSLIPYINKNAHTFDLDDLDKWTEPADIVICTSTIHHIRGDKEKFIKECRRLTKELFVLECPVMLEDGLKLILDRWDKPIPTKQLLEHWILKYFKTFEIIGESIVLDGTHRLIYHCK